MWNIAILWDSSSEILLSNKWSEICLSSCVVHMHWELVNLMYTELEGGWGDMASDQVQRAAVHEGHVRSRSHSRHNWRGDVDIRWQCDAATRHFVFTLYWTISQRRSELGEGVVSHHWGSWGMNLTTNLWLYVMTVTSSSAMTEKPRDAYFTFFWLTSSFIRKMAKSRFWLADSLFCGL